MHNSSSTSKPAGFKPRIWKSSNVFVGLRDEIVLLYNQQILVNVKS
jgi:hypothetical protein